MGRHGRAHRHRPYPSPSYFSTQSYTNKITIYGQSAQTKSTVPRVICPNDINHPHAIHPNETVGAVPVCPPERPRSGISIREIGFVYHTLCAGDERRMRPCGAKRAGTQAPPLPISIIFFHAIPHKQNSVHVNPSLPISQKPRGVSLPHRGYTFDSAGLASVTQPTLGNSASEDTTPLGGCTFSHHTSLPHAANGLFANDFSIRKLILKSTMPMA